ncbi:uncharacterized protein K452DRAFT_301023 [Aplosporella prunicola CBS 121167]|uniref:CCHC-type domain-containing protein n=1 Tax=Aplosporella prunicola CBS 121167 TaxID=1176127 RepID=A0A6A6B3U3_9PEZI|nr:uncharacterized protein K452DRAFT_301023 [Aplosporella prunicola CBS 121167]KAF2138486.1 hypothetical protein K452DRAFT_301023 [Aplosporella prunicola CBS 121167]
MQRAQEEEEEDDSRTATVGRKRPRDQGAAPSPRSSPAASQQRLGSESPPSEPRDTPSPNSHLLRPDRSPDPHPDAFPHMADGKQAHAKAAELSGAQASLEEASQPAADKPRRQSLSANDDFIAFGDIGEEGEGEASTDGSGDRNGDANAAAAALGNSKRKKKRNRNKDKDKDKPKTISLSATQKTKILGYEKDLAEEFLQTELDTLWSEAQNKPKDCHVALVRMQIPQRAGKKGTHNLVPKDQLRKSFYNWAGTHVHTDLVGLFEDQAGEGSPEINMLLLFKSPEGASEVHQKIASSPPVFTITEDGSTKNIDIAVSVSGEDAARELMYKGDSSGRIAVRAFASGKADVVQSLILNGSLKIGDYPGLQNERKRKKINDIKEPKNATAQGSAESSAASEGQQQGASGAQTPASALSGTAASTSGAQNGEQASADEVIDLTGGEEGELLGQAGQMLRTQMADLSSEERELQTRYFGALKDSDSVHCLTCGLLEHMSEVCPSRICKHCRAVDVHTSGACPTMSKCTKCRERGHQKKNCPSKLARSSADGFVCDLCKEKGHIEEECALLWRTFIPEKVPNIHKVAMLTVTCYQCASDRHWGDDCPMRPRRAYFNTDTFSAKQANKYLIDPQAAAQERNAGGISIKGRAENNVINLDSDDEDDADMANFYGRKAPAHGPVRGSIRINASGGRGGNGGGNGAARGRPSGNNAPPMGRYETRRPRSRSRSPMPHGGGGGYGYRQRDDGGGPKSKQSGRGWQPPLPNEPLPPMPGGRRGGGGGGRGRGGGRGGNGGGRGGRGRGRGR